MRIFTIAAAAIVIAALLVTANRTRASGSVHSIPRPEVLGLKAPLGSAHIGPQQAITSAEASSFGPALRKGVGMTARYGSWVSPQVRAMSSDHIVKEPARDVWAVTVGGLNIPSHGPIGVPPPEYRHYMTIVVDDATNRVLMTEVY